MRERNKIIMEYGTYMLAYFASYIASLAGLHLLSGALLIIEALYLYVHWVRESGSVVEMRALFTLAWVGGQGIACLKLSELQTDWHYITWLCFGLIYLVFGIGYEWGQKYVRVREFELEKNEIQKKRLFLCIMGLAVVSILCFAFEAVKVGFIPVFSDKPHAYSYFHVSGVHYFTISCILIPAITVLYRKVSGRLAKGEFFAIAFANVTALAIPFLCVSRFQLLFAVGFAVVTYIMVNKKIRLRTMVILLAAMIPERYDALVARGARYGYSRIVLGVHYPLDVIGSRMVAERNVAPYLNDPHYRVLFNEARDQLRAALAKACGTSLAECAKSSVKDDPWRDPAMRDFSRFTMTYDLPQQKGPQPRLQVPEGAEVLLEDALPHLSAAQRRTLMVNTALPAGYPLSGTTPEQQFWQRLNLSAAWEMAQKSQ